MAALEQALWLALLSDDGLDRAAAKSALYQLTVIDQLSLTECAEMTVAALQALLPDYAPEELARWPLAFGRALSARERLSRWGDQGISMLTRASPLYPEGLAERLPERWLPYLLFYMGDLRLLDRPMLYASGSGAPTNETADWTRSLVPHVSSLPLCCVGVYTQGVERLVLDAMASKEGSTILMLPLGLDHAAPILKTSQPAMKRQARLVLSPYLPDTDYTQALGRASRRLATALSDVLMLIDPDESPAAWPGLSDHQRRGGQVLLHSSDQSGQRDAWVENGAISVSELAQAVTLLTVDLGLDMEHDPVAPEIGAVDASASAVYFDTADSAIATLTAAGRVPEGLRRRLRDAEKRGILRGEG